MVVLAVDMPHVTAATIAPAAGRLRRAGRAPGSSTPTGAASSPASYAVTSCRLLEEAAGLPMRVLMAHPDCADVAADGPEGADVDTWDDASRLGITRDTSHRT